jgi:hypothetical protein
LNNERIPRRVIIALVVLYGVVGPCLYLLGKVGEHYGEEQQRRTWMVIQEKIAMDMMHP